MDVIQSIVQAESSRWILGFLTATGVAFLGHRNKSLTTSGAFSAAAIGGLIVGAGGWWTGFLLVVFFVTSSALSHARRDATPTVDQVRQVRGSRRDAVQVFANGGVPVLCAVVGSLVSEPQPWRIAAAAAIASATADTWATEIGRRSHTHPRSIISWKPLPPGTSGAISAPGTAGSLAGALLIAIIASAGSAAGTWIDADAPTVGIVIVISGAAGSLFDSVLGATLQGIWWCPACDVVTESALHHCGTPTRLQRGVPGVNNDLVNALSIAGSGIIGLILGFGSS